MAERRRRRAASGWTTASRLRSLVFLCWGILLIVSVTAIGSLQLQSRNISRLTLLEIPSVDANNQVLQAMTDAYTGLAGYQTSGDRELLQPYFGAHERTMTALAALTAKFRLAYDGNAAMAMHRGLERRQRLAAGQWWADAVSTEQALAQGRPTNVFVGRALFSRFRAANATLGEHLTTERDQSRLATRATASRGEAISIAATFLALLAMLVLGNQVARTISVPLSELRDTMVRQRKGEPGARAREDQGSLELRSVASDFNELTQSNLDLQQTQAHALGTHQITFEIARAIRTASDTQQALDVMCAALGVGLGADRVVAKTLGGAHDVLLVAQWHGPNLPPVGDLRLLPEMGEGAESMWISRDFDERDDLLEVGTRSQERGRAFHRLTGARAVIMVPIGLHDGVIGAIYVLMVREPRRWATAEANVVQAVAGFVARAMVEAQNQARQSEYVEQIERLDRQKSDFLATVSHELRTPLTSINGYLELLQDGDVGALTEPQQRMLEVISRNTDRLRSLIEDVMVLSRIEGEVTNNNFGQVSIPELITRVGEELSLLALRSAIQVEIDVGPQAALVRGDQASLDRAMVNILANAIKFSHPGGVVTLRCRVDEGKSRVRITCQDHGVGIPTHDQGDLFTRFFRASNATDQAIPGTGLGLSIAKQIVEDLHGGSLGLVSVEHEGTNVVIDLPLVTPARTRVAVGKDSHSAHV